MTWRMSRDVSRDTPDPVAVFMEEFDNGRYPELVA